LKPPHRRAGEAIYAGLENIYNGLKQKTTEQHGADSPSSGPTSDSMAVVEELFNSIEKLKNEFDGLRKELQNVVRAFEVNQEFMSKKGAAKHAAPHAMAPMRHKGRSKGSVRLWLGYAVSSS